MEPVLLVTDLINQLLPEPHAGLLSGILFGTKASLDPELKNALIRTGTLHIVALSGMNITILINLVATTLHYAFSKRITILLTVIIIIGFVWFTGTSPSVVRAAIMGCLSLLAVLTGRISRSIYLLLLASLCMVIVVPSWLTDLSFQLSFLATLGLIVFNKQTVRTVNTHSQSPVSPSRLKAVAKYCWDVVGDDLRTTLSAQVFTIPLIFVAFNRISLIAPLSNIAIGWIIPLLTVSGMLLCLVASLSITLAAPLSWFLYLMLDYILTVVTLLSRLPFASLE